jgi:hypothetical protein
MKHRLFAELASATAGDKLYKDMNDMERVIHYVNTFFGVKITQITTY